MWKLIIVAVFNPYQPVDAPVLMSQYNRFLKTEQQCEMEANKAEEKEYIQFASGEVIITAYCMEQKNERYKR
jgi:hypothetical protein